MDQIIQLGSEYAWKLAELNKQLIEDEGHRNLMSVAELAKRMESWLSSEYSCYGVVGGDEIKAYCLYRDDAEYFYIRQIFTARELRRLGLASKLLNYVETTILIEKPIRIEVLVGNEGAKAFYLSRGYNFYCHTLEKNA